MNGVASDEEVRQLVLSFESLTMRYEDWTHPSHLTVAAVYVLRYGDEALDRIRAGILRLNGHFGVEQTPTAGYHETLTVAWTRLIRNELAHHEESATVHDRISRVIEALSDKSVILRHYSRERIMSAGARCGWIEPDLEPLP